MIFPVSFLPRRKSRPKKTGPKSLFATTWIKSCFRAGFQGSHPRHRCLITQFPSHCRKKGSSPCENAWKLLHRLRVQQAAALDQKGVQIDACARLGEARECVNRYASPGVNPSHEAWISLDMSLFRDVSRDVCRRASCRLSIRWRSIRSVLWQRNNCVRKLDPRPLGIWP